MRILWIVNNVMPKLAKKTNLSGSSSGSWLIDISEQLSITDGIKLAIACVGGKTFSKHEIDNITYYLLPGNGKNMLFYTKKYEKLWKKINEEFKPDIVHLYGTEYSHGLSFLRANPEVKAVVSVQGIISRISGVMFDGLPKNFDCKYSTLKERIKFNGLKMRRLLYKRNSKYEKEILSRVKYASIVNDWDYSVAREINDKLIFFPIQYNLRDGFYSANKWDIKNIIPRRIFVAPGNDPVKGFHQLLKAIYLLKKKYPDVKVAVPGLSGNNGKLVVINGYTKYLNKLINDFDLSNNLEFLGRLGESDMIEHMLKANAVVVPSQIEGTSLILREAMYLGVPTVASFRGGMADFISDKVDGFLYDFNEYQLLALRLEQLFDNEDLAKEISAKAILKAEKAHDRQKNIQDNLDMYNKIFEDGIENE